MGKSPSVTELLSCQTSQPMRALTTVVTVVGLALLSSSIAWAQFTTVLNLPPDALPFPIDSDTQVNLLDGGEIPHSSRSGETDGSSSNIEVNVLGGTVGSQVQLYGGTTFNVSGGLVGSQLQVFSGATVNVTGGRILGSLTANDGSNINLSGGIIDPRFSARFGSSVFVSGGTIGSEFRIENGSQVSLSDGELESASIQFGGIMNMTGGPAQLSVQGNLTLSGGTVRRNFDTSAGAEVRILGGEYRLGGVPIAELQNTGDLFTPLVPPGAVLSGTLADGTPFAFSSRNGDDIAAGTLVLENVTLPAIGPATILASTDPVPRGIRQGQQLVIDAGGASPHSFHAGWGSSVVVQSGGVLEEGFEGLHSTVDIVGGTTKNRMTVYEQSTINIGEGSNVGEILADGQSTIEVNGGVTSFIDVVGGSVINMHNGIVTQGMNIHSGAVANLFGGTVGPLFRPMAGSTLNVHGGTIGNSV